MVADAKCVKIRLREKTPTLRYGKYAGYSVREVVQDQRYWQNQVARNPIKFLGSLSRFIEIDAREQQRLKQRLQERKDREIMQSLAAAVSKKHVEKPSDYTYSGEEEVIGAGVFKGMSFKDSPYKSKCETLGKVLVGQYRVGFLRDPSLRDLARYVQQEKAFAKEDKKAATQAKKAATANKKASKSVGKKSAVSRKRALGRRVRSVVQSVRQRMMRLEIPETVLAKADPAGMTGALKKLLCRDDIKDAKISPFAAMSALEASGGLLHKARAALLGA